MLLSLPFAGGRLNPPEVTGRSLPKAFSFRTEMTRMTLRMIAAQPVFGVGVGTFYARSSGYFTPGFTSVVPNENAHNNFLQVFAELGLVGLVPFLWTIVAAGAAVARGWRSGKPTAVVAGGAAGLAAFVLTWLTGHPLLIFPVATAFWLVLAAVTALAGEDDLAAHATGRWPRGRVRAFAAAIIVVAAVASVPLRGRDAAEQTNLSGAALGLSPWDTGAGGERFRRMTAPVVQFYIDAGATSMTLPVRLEGNWPEQTTVDVEVRLDGEPAHRVRVAGTGWDAVTLSLPPLGPSRRFRAVRLSLVSGGPWTARRRGPAVEIGVPLLTRPGGR